MIAAGNEVSRFKQRRFINEDYLEKDLIHRGHARDTTT